MTDGSMPHETLGMRSAGSEYSPAHMLVDKARDGGILISFNKGLDYVSSDPRAAPGTAIGTEITFLSPGQAGNESQMADVGNHPFKSSVPVRNFDPPHSLFEGTFLPPAPEENGLYHGHLDGEPQCYIKVEEQEEMPYSSARLQDEQYIRSNHYSGYPVEEQGGIHAHHLRHGNKVQEQTQQNHHVRHKKRMDPEKSALIEERIKRERPNRTLFIRNLGYNADLEDVRALYAPFGEIKSLYSLIENRGLAFITYFDIRAAEYAKRETHGMELDGRELDVHYSLPRDGQYSKDCTKDNNNGTIFAFLKCPRSTILTDQDVEDFFSVYGEIKLIKKNPHTPGPCRFVEFFDSRACVRAVSEGKDQRLLGGVLDCKFAWDQPRGYPPVYSKSGGHAARDEKRHMSRSDHHARMPSPPRSHRLYNPDENAYEASLRRRKSSDINREQTASRRESYGSSSRLDRSESRDRGSYHSRSYQERSVNDRQEDRQESSYDERSKRESSYDVPAKRESSYDIRIKRESSHSFRLRPSDRDLEKTNSKEWGRDTFRSRSRSRSRGHSENHGWTFESSSATYDRDHIGSSSNEQLQSAARIFDEQRQPTSAPSFGSRPLGSLSFRVAANSPKGVTSPTDITLASATLKERMEQAQKAQMLMNTVLQMSKNTGPGQTVAAVKLEDRSTVEPQRPPTPAVHPAVSSRGEYGNHNTDPLVKSRQTSGVPLPMPNFITSPVAYNQLEQSHSPRQKLYDECSTSKSHTGLTTSPPSGPFVKAPITPSAPSHTSSTEAQVHQLLQLLTQVQQQSRASTNGSSALAQNANGPDLMSLMPHLSQLSTLVQQSLRGPNEQQQPHLPHSSQLPFQQTGGQLTSKPPPMFQQDIRPVELNLTRGAGTGSIATPPPPPGPRPSMPTQSCSNVASARNPSMAFRPIRTPLLPQTDTVLSALPMSDIQRSYIQRKNNGDILSFDPTASSSQIEIERKPQPGVAVPQISRISRPMGSQGLFAGSHSRESQGASDRSKDYRKLDENFENQYRNRTYPKVETRPRSDSKKRRLEDDGDGEYSRRKRNYRERSAIQEDHDYDRGGENGWHRSKNFVKSNSCEEISYAQPKTKGQEPSFTKTTYDTNYGNRENHYNHLRHGNVDQVEEQGRVFQREGAMPGARGRGRGRGSHRGEFGNGGRGGRGRGRGRGVFHPDNGQSLRYENFDDQNHVGAKGSMSRVVSGGSIDIQQAGQYHDQIQRHGQNENYGPAGRIVSVREERIQRR
ncbi:hypothetical protein EMPS_07449 [Entomortierella parvispora]|uniref:RRM domain-containing protein n=1 Tax=Entomortierella parvispora TaxID=205924 RepID=A0A9P3HEF9_9FUNG|nr:hypothetical protein EMPS_07449 [Entomortierella parvispora]